MYYVKVFQGNSIQLELSMNKWFSDNKDIKVINVTQSQHGDYAMVTVIYQYYI